MLLPTINEVANTPEELEKRRAQVRCSMRWCQATLSEVYHALYDLSIPNVRSLVKEHSDVRAGDIDLFHFLQTDSTFNVIEQLDKPAETPEELQRKFDKLMHYRSVFQAFIDQMRLELSSLKAILTPIESAE